MWRGGSRSGLSVAAPFVWRCPSNLAVTPFPHPAHRTGHADLPHPALGPRLHAFECGDLHCGFARIRCGGCGHDLLLAFSCKTRYFCPSCHQKRVLAYGEWVEQCVLRPVPHRQYVFTVPKLIRPFFAYRRSLLGELCRIVARALTQAYGAALPRARPGFILFVQTFGNLVNFNPHVHALVADGVFEASGRFIPLPPIPEALLGERLRREVLGLLVRREAILPPLAAQMLAWR
ncbi:MAG TPA: transposase zinc-binding domain-containing protein, partial [Vicinamibacterales bacterium]|nr:transposase zinc-binding domain-containing protein [Vicinamibacterales bacterium]